MEENERLKKSILVTEDVHKELSLLRIKLGVRSVSKVLEILLKGNRLPEVTL